MIFQAIATVHTTGVNWTSVVTIVGSVCVILGAMGTVIARYVSGQVTSAINVFRVDVVSKLDNRLSAVESKLDMIAENNPPMGPYTRSRRRE
jgi:hypothetical protein